MELSVTVLSMKKLLLSYMKLGSRREVSRSKSNVMALCSRTDTVNSQEMYAGWRKISKSCVVSNFVSADRIQVDRIRLRWNWIESKSNLVASANAPQKKEAMLHNILVPLTSLYMLHIFTHCTVPCPLP